LQGRCLNPGVILVPRRTNKRKEKTETMTNPTRNAAIALVAILVTTGAAPAAPRGRWWRTGGSRQWSRQSTKTWPNGSQRNVQASGSYGNGQLSKNKTITGRNGRQATVNTTGTYGNGQFSKDKTITGPNGRQATVDTTGTYGNGQFSKNKTITGPNGRQTTVQTSGTTSKQQ
jgi:hypothetical protein